jgi:hypothetical protein
MSLRLNLPNINYTHLYYKRNPHPNHVETNKQSDWLTHNNSHDNKHSGGPSEHSEGGRICMGQLLVFLKMNGKILVIFDI